MGGVPLWELLRRREVRELIGNRGGFSLTAGSARFLLGVPIREGWRLERLRLLLGRGSLLNLPDGYRRRYVLSGAPLQRLVVAFEGHPTPPRWGDRFRQLQQRLGVNPPRQRSRSTPPMSEPAVAEAPVRPFSAPTLTTLRVLRSSPEELVFGPDPRWDLPSQLQWLAGLVDGSGTLSVRSGGGSQLVVSGHRWELEVLERVQTLLGHGSVGNRSGGDDAAVYTLSYGHRLWQLLPQLGPYLRHPTRRRQLRELCHRLKGIPVPEPVSLTQNRGWAGGVIQAGGSIGLECSRRTGGSQSLTAAVSFANSDRSLVEAVASLFPKQGHFRVPQHPEESSAFLWRVRSQADVEAVCSYLQSVPFFGPKAQRVALLQGGFYGLRRQGAHQPSSPHHPEWLQWLLEWARTWGGTAEQRAQLARFLPPEVVDGLVPPPING